MLTGNLTRPLTIVLNMNSSGNHEGYQMLLKRRKSFVTWYFARTPLLKKVTIEECTFGHIYPILFSIS